MRKLKSAKLYLFLAVLLFVAKPFLGFGMFNRAHPPAEDNIFIKVFSKRKLEFSEDSVFSITDVEKKLANPPLQVLLRFSVLLSILFPAVIIAAAEATSHILKAIRLGLLPRGDTWLFNSKLII
jgi:hypothetical protein